MAAITADQLANYVADQERRLKLYRQLDSLKRKMQPLEEHFLAVLQAAEKRSVKRHGYTIEIIDGSPVVRWKDEFIAACGDKAAEKLQAKAPIPQRVRVLPA